MTNKIEVPRELLVIANVCVMRSHDLLVEQLKITDHKDEYRAEITRLKDTHDQLVAALAAPEAPRQEPAMWQVRHFVEQYGWGDWEQVRVAGSYVGESIESRLNELRCYISRGCKYEILALYTSPTAPLSPDHSGGGAGVVLPERNTIYVTKPIIMDGTELIQVWQACLDKVKELNQ